MIVKKYMDYVGEHNDLNDIKYYLSKEYKNNKYTFVWFSNYELNNERLETCSIVFQKLKTMQAIPIQIYRQFDLLEIGYEAWLGDGQKYLDIVGFKIGENDGCYPKALTHLPWNELLSMEIGCATERTYKPHEIIAHCIWHKLALSCWLNNDLIYVRETL